jgi:hypothetical protein
MADQKPSDSTGQTPSGAPAAQPAFQPDGKTDGHTFPDPSLTLIEIGDAFAVLIAARTEPDPANRRLVLKKVAYVRLESDGWGAAGLPEAWIQQNAEGLFLVVDPVTGRVFREPSRRRYEVGFLSKEIFECTIQCLKDRQPGPIYELAVVTFAKRKGFSFEAGGLLAPDDYAGERGVVPDDQLVPLPPRLSSGAAS